MARNKVLVVDDEKNQREIYTMILEDDGYEVTTAQSGEQALRFARDQPIQRRLPTYDPINQLLAEAAVRRGKLGSGQRGIEKIFHKVGSGGSALQNLGRNLSWFLLGQFV